MYIFQALVYFDGFSSHLHGSFLQRCHALLHTAALLSRGICFFCQDSDDDTSKDGVTALDLFKDARV